MNGTDATVEPLEPGPACSFASGGTVWYAYTPAVDGTVFASLDSANAYPGMISAYTGGALSSLSLSACTVFFGPPNSQAFHVTAGTTYYFQVRHLSSASPPNTPLTFGLTFQSDGPPAVANDRFADATVVSALPFADVVDNSLATSELGEPGFCGPTNRTVWYRFTPSATVVVRADETGTAFATGESELGLYRQTGTGIGGLASLACVFNSSPLRFTAEAGVTYYLQAGSFSGPGGMLHVNVQALVPPANDDFEQATAVTALPFSAPLDLTAATRQPAEPTPSCGGFPAQTAWYSFTPAVSGTYTGGLTAAGGFTFAVEYGVYTGGTLATLAQTGCNLGNPLQFDAVKGTTYFVQVASFAGLGQPTTFSLRLVRAFDTVPPVLNMPAGIADDATGPGGVIVSYTVTATDDVDGPTAASCSPPSGSSFAIGDATVTCSATDAAGNVASGSFAVHVRDAAEQLANLAVAVTGLGPGTSLADQVADAQAALRSGDRAGAIAILRTIANAVRAQSGKKITPEVAAARIADANRIVSVLA